MSPAGRLRVVAPLVKLGFILVGLAWFAFIVWLSQTAPELLPLVILIEWWLIWRMINRPLT